MNGDDGARVVCWRAVVGRRETNNVFVYLRLSIWRCATGHQFSGLISSDQSAHVSVGLRPEWAARERLQWPVEAALRLATLFAALGRSAGPIVGPVRGRRRRRLLVGWCRCRWRRLAAWHSGSKLAFQGVGIHGKTGGATLQTRVTAHAQPIADTGFLNENQTVWSVLTDWMLLAIWNIVWPIT